MEQQGFHFNARRCTGCKTCVLACKDYKNLDESVSFRQVYEFSGGEWIWDDGGWKQDCFCFYVSSACNHCAHPACMEVCPTGAMGRNDLGLVCVDEHRCIGCGYCALSCPYHAPKVDRSVGHSAKCDGCTERVFEGKVPVCVEACPVRALDFGPIGALRERYGSRAEVPPLPDAAETSPNLVVTPPACMGEDEAAVRSRGAVRNVRELV